MCYTYENHVFTNLSFLFMRLQFYLFGSIFLGVHSISGISKWFFSQVIKGGYIFIPIWGKSNISKSLSPPEQSLFFVLFCSHSVQNCHLSPSVKPMEMYQRNVPSRVFCMRTNSMYMYPIVYRSVIM